MESIISQAKEITSTIKEFQKNLNLVIANIFKSKYPENTIDGYDIDELKAYCLYDCDYDTLPMTTISFIGRNKSSDKPEIFLTYCITNGPFSESIYDEHYFSCEPRTYCYVKSSNEYCGILINKSIKHTSDDDLNKFNEISVALEELISGIDVEMVVRKNV